MSCGMKTTYGNFLVSSQRRMHPVAGVANKLCVDARRNGFVALLSGDCADEVFGGYGYYEDAVARADTLEHRMVN